MTKKEALLLRLSEIGGSLKNTGRALALLGLGSVGMERERLDEFSDLDFFAIVKDGNKAQFIEDLSWLSAINPIAYYFKNTHDGYKLLFDDGIFCEFAVFEKSELQGIDFSPGLVVWKEEGFDEACCIPRTRQQCASSHSLDWITGELLTNLFVGLSRYARGEKLSAFRFIQGYAVDRIMELMEMLEKENCFIKDIFSQERRFENRYPVNGKLLPEFMQGYELSRESAKAMLLFVEKNFGVNPGMKKAILDLCE